MLMGNIPVYEATRAAAMAAFAKSWARGLKLKNPPAPAVKREAEEDWGRGRWR
jgi:hypothetical protein